MSNDPINPGEGWRILKLYECRDIGDEQAEVDTWRILTDDEIGMQVNHCTVRRRLERTQAQMDEEAYYERLAKHPLENNRAWWDAALAYARKGEGK